MTLVRPMKAVAEVVAGLYVWSAQNGCDPTTPCAGWRESSLIPSRRRRSCVAMLRRCGTSNFSQNIEKHTLVDLAAIQLTPHAAACVLSSAPGRRGRWLSFKTGYHGKSRTMPSLQSLPS